MRTMQKIIFAVMAVVLLPLAAQADSDMKEFPISDALNSPAAKDKVDRAILFFADEYSGSETVTENVLAGPRVQKARGKKVKESCNEAFVEALVSLQAQAAVKKATAVVNIHSYIPIPFVPDMPFVSNTEYICEVGRKMVRVILKGGLIHQPGASAGKQTTESAADRLRKLKELRKQGLIDETAYKRREAEILREL